MAPPSLRLVVVELVRVLVVVVVLVCVLVVVMVVRVLLLLPLPLLRLMFHDRWGWVILLWPYFRLVCPLVPSCG